MPQCAHHVASTTLEDCSKVTQVNPKCTKQCTGKTTIDYSSDKNKSTSSYSVKGVEALQTELMTNGPLTVAFTVYADFPA